MNNQKSSRADYLADLALRGVFRACLALPYTWRVPLMGWIMARVVAPVAGYHKRIRENLAYVMPQMPEAEVRRMIRAVPDNFGRAMIETYSGDEFKAQLKNTALTGDGVAALAQARQDNRPVLLVTGHFGNYDAPRAVLIANGYTVGGLYRPASNAYFNRHYSAAISEIGLPLFTTERRDLPKMVRFIRDGGIQGIVLDMNSFGGAHLDFLGKPALTATATAEMALKYDALVLPIYGIRQPDGLSFEIRIEAPIPHTDPETMTQALNDSLAALVRQYPEQWLWIHRRWKLPRDN